jgi:acyl-CoA thioester hydrolase
MTISNDDLTVTLNSELLSDLAHSFAIDFTVAENEIDSSGYLNEAVVVMWLNRVQTAHTFHLGINPTALRQAQISLVIHRLGLDWLRPVSIGDTIRVGTQISQFEEETKLGRRFQIVRIADSTTILRAVAEYITVDSQTAAPAKLPPAICETLAKSVSATRPL